MATTAAVPPNVRRLLDGRPLTWLARQAGWSKSYLGDRMTGRVGWSADELVTLARILGTTADVLLDDEAVSAP